MTWQVLAGWDNGHVDDTRRYYHSESIAITEKHGLVQHTISGHKMPNPGDHVLPISISEARTGLEIWYVTDSIDFEQFQSAWRQLDKYVNSQKTRLVA